MKPPWPFDQKPNVAAITTRQVLEGHPILCVVHYKDDHSWAFTCGTTDVASDGRVISMAETLEMDGSLVSVANLPPGWGAWRESVGGAWHRHCLGQDF